LVNLKSNLLDDVMKSTRPLIIFAIVFLAVSCSEAERNVSAEILPDSYSNNAILRIIRDGKSQEISVKSIVDDISISPFGRIRTVSDLDLDGEPEVVLDITTEGAYCCTVIVVMFYDKNVQQYQSSNLLIKNWGLSPKLVDVDEDNKPEFVTRDYDYFWLPTATAAISPIQIFRFDGGQIVDVTNEYPYFIEQDAQLWLALLRNQKPELSEDYLELYSRQVEYLFTEDRLREEAMKRQIIFPTYLADMQLLGRFGEGWAKADEFCQDDDCKESLSRIREAILQK